MPSISNMTFEARSSGALLGSVLLTSIWLGGCALEGAEPGAGANSFDPLEIEASDYSDAGAPQAMGFGPESPPGSQTLESVREECGDGRIGPMEECELVSPISSGCEVLGYAPGGLLRCDPSTCRFDVSGCRDTNTDSQGTRAAANSTSQGTLPAPSALDAPGPFEILDLLETGPDNVYRLFAPIATGTPALKHPVLIWSPGEGVLPELYRTFLEHVASHGFIVLSYNVTAHSQRVTAGLDWLLAESEREGSVVYGRVDAAHMAAGGHSLGSVVTYQAATDPRLQTTVHISGGTLVPLAEVPKLRKPALMVCGSEGGDGIATGDVSNPFCSADFNLASVPVFYAVVDGAGHSTLVDVDASLIGAGAAQQDTFKRLFMKVTTGWLRWQLADDQSLRDLFVGDECELCAADSGYTVQQKMLE